MTKSRNDRRKRRPRTQARAQGRRFYLPPVLGQSPGGADEAVSRLATLGLEPVEPYPGRSTAPWSVRCVGCGTAARKRLRGGRGCRRPSARTSAVELTRRPTFGKAGGLGFTAGQAA